MGASQQFAVFGWGHLYSKGHKNWHYLKYNIRTVKKHRSWWPHFKMGTSQKFADIRWEHLYSKGRKNNTTWNLTLQTHSEKKIEVGDHISKCVHLKNLLSSDGSIRTAKNTTWNLTLQCWWPHFKMVASQKFAVIRWEHLYSKSHKNIYIIQWKQTEVSD